jgi:hypothetical protein
MRTDRLIDVLSTNLEPVKRGQLARALAVALIAGAIVAFCLMLATLGLRGDLAAPGRFAFLGLKLLFMLSVAGIGAALLAQLIRPGYDTRRRMVLLVVPFALIGAAALVALGVTHAETWPVMILGSQWATCVMCIPLFAVIPFGALVLALRQGAPTDPRRTGAVAGIVAAALGGAAYAFHCPDDSLPFIAIWYGVPIVLWAIAGAWLGPRLLRW